MVGRAFSRGGKIQPWMKRVTQIILPQKNTKNTNESLWGWSQAKAETVNHPNAVQASDSGDSETETKVA